MQKNRSVWAIFPPSYIVHCTLYIVHRLLPQHFQSYFLFWFHSSSFSILSLFPSFFIAVSTILSLLSCSDSTRIPPYYSVFWSIRFPSVPPAVSPSSNSLSFEILSFVLLFLSFVLLFPYSIHFKCFTIPFSWASRDHLVSISWSSRMHRLSISFHIDDHLSCRVCHLPAVTGFSYFFFCLFDWWTIESCTIRHRGLINYGWRQPCAFCGAF